MLIARIYINNTPLEDILIHNTGIKTIFDDTYIYEVMDPENPKERLADTTLYHRRSDGYRQLLMKVLKFLEADNIESGTLNYAKT